MSDTHDHWQDVWKRKGPREQSWHQVDPATSLALIDQVGAPIPARLIDVGAGSSALVAALLDRGGFEITAVDIAPAALDALRLRIDHPGRVRWLAADIREPLPKMAPFDIWHDRAVFHFLTKEEERAAYLANLKRLLRPRGHVVIGTFALDGPEKCSGLPVQRYSAKTLADTLGPEFELVDDRHEVHVTPWGSEQSFTWALFQRMG